MRKFFLYCFAIIFLFGGIMGIAKGFSPEMEWLSFRYILGGGASFEAQDTPLYARVYGVVMGSLEIIAVALILCRQRKWLFIEVILLINMLGCLIALAFGDMFSIVSFAIRIIPLYLLDKERRTETSPR
ncbi:MAG: hypothetical protein FWF69_05705 [Firmicutes bacterium]|nr:hypothetical protein [Bacillota bacterium]